MNFNKDRAKVKNTIESESIPISLPIENSEEQNIKFIDVT